MSSVPAKDLGSRTAGALVSTRRIVHRTRGQTHGPITRLVSPSDLGQLIKPFIFLDQIDIVSGAAPAFGWHPHSGIATITLLIEGGFGYEDATGKTGTMTPGAVEWLRAGGGVWHAGKGAGIPLKGYQLWVALPPELENGPAFSEYLNQETFPEVGPARVILGELGASHSPITSPSPMNYLDVRLKAGEIWRYQPPTGHDVAWIAVHQGTAMTAEQSVASGELVVFDKAESAIGFQALGDTSFVLGSAAAHPYDLVMGYYSVHTNADALQRGEDNIERIKKELHRAGKL